MKKELYWGIRFMCQYTRAAESEKQGVSEYKSPMGNDKITII